MRKILIPLLVSVILSGLVSLVLWEFSYTASNNLTVKLDLQVSKYDRFQLFFTDDENPDFSDKRSVTKTIMGSPDFQTLDFEIHPEKPIKSIRIDIGANKKQGPMKIESITFQRPLSSVSYKVSKISTPNEFVALKDGVYSTRSIKKEKELYDPFLIVDISIDTVVQGLLKEQKRMENLFRLLLAIFIASLTFIYLYKRADQHSTSLNIYIILFACFLLWPSLMDVLGLEAKAKLIEKRKLEAKPKQEISADFPKKFDAYYADHFDLREVFINALSKFKVLVLGISPKPETVQIGHDGFLFFNSVKDYYTPGEYTLKELESFYNAQLYTKRALKAGGIDYVVGFWPNKHTIYSDKFPLAMEMQPTPAITVADQVSDFFKERKGIHLFDVREDLLEAKKKKQIYRKIDTHWNAHGAYEAYRSFCRQTYSTLGLQAFDFEHFDIHYEKPKSNDLVNILGITGEDSFFKEELPHYTLKDKELRFVFTQKKELEKKVKITINKNCKNKQTALVFRDSYSTELIQFLSLHYQKVVYLWSHPAGSYSVNYLKIVGQIRPNVIINCSVERHLPGLLSHGIVKEVVERGKRK